MVASKVPVAKTLIVVPNATRAQMDRIAEELKSTRDKIFISAEDVKVFKIVKGELFEIITSEKTLGKIKDKYQNIPKTTKSVETED